MNTSSSVSICIFLKVYQRYTPGKKYTPVVYLVTEGGDKIPIPMEPAVKP